MTRTRVLAPTVATILIAIGCGSGKPQDAAAKTDASGAQGTMQLAEAPAGAQPAGATGSASIQGTVKFAGTAPAMDKVKMDADPTCQQQHPAPVTAEAVVVNGNGTLKNVFVYVKDGVAGTYPAPATPVVLNQSGCWYMPHAFGIQANQPLEIVNNDSTLHNINAKPKANQPFNVAQPVKGMKTTKKFTTPEVMVSFKCNVHPWMQAYAGVVSHPFFAVSDGTGSFTISRLPAGTYVLEAWHEKYGTQTQTVTVADGETKSIELTFKAQ